jgi:succinoglycan biosynthesis protein ExoA
MAAQIDLLPITRPFVSVIVPVLDEEKHVMACVESLLAQDYPAAGYEIILIDGGSTDATIPLISELSRREHRVILLSNPRRTTASSLNVGLKHARGEIIVRMDAHAQATSDYVSTCVNILLNGGADTVGGLITPAGRGYWGESIALAVSCAFGVGNSKYRCSGTGGDDEAGWPGAFRKQTLIEIGGYDENLECNEDDDLTYRLLKSGAKVHRSSLLRTTYYCRETLSGLWRQYFRYGFWKVRVIQNYGRLTSLRHIIPALFLVSLPAAAALSLAFTPFRRVLQLELLLYGLLSLTFAARRARGRRLRYVVTMPVVYAVLHASYGLGFILGLPRSLFKTADRIGRPARPGVALPLPSTLPAVGRRGGLNFRPAARPPWSKALLKWGGFRLLVYCADAAYDLYRNLRYGNSFHRPKRGRAELEPLLFMYHHKIEKTLALPEVRVPFGLEYVPALLGLMEKWVSSGGHLGAAPFRGACGALTRYREKMGPFLRQHEPDLLARADKLLHSSAHGEPADAGGGVLELSAEVLIKDTEGTDFGRFVRLRHSVRNFAEKRIPDNEISRAVATAQRSPSVCNRQSSRVHVYTAAGDKEQVLRLQNGNDGFGHLADRVLLVTSDIRSFVSSGERHQGYVDAGMFAMTLVYALHARGIASCCLNLSTYSFQDVALRRACLIPAWETPIMMIAVGYPPERFKVAASARLPTDSVLRFRDLSADR